VRGGEKGKKKRPAAFPDRRAAFYYPEGAEELPEGGEREKEEKKRSFPHALTLRWSHGEPGQDKEERREKRGGERVPRKRTNAPGVAGPGLGDFDTCERGRGKGKRESPIYLTDSAGERTEQKGGGGGRGGEGKKKRFRCLAGSVMLPMKMFILFWSGKVEEDGKRKKKKRDRLFTAIP